MRIDIVADYRIGGESLRPFFDPIHQIDRKVRPTTWESIEVNVRGLTE
jgi:hypothetical protein